MLSTSALDRGAVAVAMVLGWASGDSTESVSSIAVARQEHGYLIGLQKCEGGREEEVCVKLANCRKSASAFSSASARLRFGTDASSAPVCRAAFASGCCSAIAIIDRDTTSFRVFHDLAIHGEYEARHAYGRSRCRNMRARYSDHCSNRAHVFVWNSRPVVASNTSREPP